MFCKFKVSVVFIMDFRVARGIQADPVFKKPGNKHPLLPRGEKNPSKNSNKSPNHLFLTLAYA